MTDTFKDVLFSGGENLNISFSEEQAEKLYDFYKSVLEYNEKVNLTAVLDEKEFVMKHLLDSISASSLIPKNASYCDIGAGAGFPSLPILIMRADVTGTLLEAHGKRVDFLNFAIERLGLKNAKAVQIRAEDAGRGEYRGTFDVVTARAVAATNILLELAVPLLKKGGLFINFKGRDLSDLPTSKNACGVLLAGHKNTTSFELPFGFGTRNLVTFEKRGATLPQYPRSYGQISKKPL